MRLLGPAATFVNAVIVKAATPLAPKPKRPRRVPGERWIEDGREMQYWPDERNAPHEPVRYFEPGGIRRALDRMSGRRSRE